MKKMNLFVNRILLAFIGPALAAVVVSPCPEVCNCLNDGGKYFRMNCTPRTNGTGLFKALQNLTIHEEGKFVTTLVL